MPLKPGKSKKTISKKNSSQMRNNSAAFEFLYNGNKEEIQELGWRIGEKWDSGWSDDFLEDIIIPLVRGIISGSANFQIEFKGKDEFSIAVKDIKSLYP